MLNQNKNIKTKQFLSFLKMSKNDLGNYIMLSGWRNIFLQHKIIN